MTQYWGTAKWGGTQNVAYTTTAGTVTNAFGAGIHKARIIVTTAAYVKVDVSPTATSSDAYVAAGVPEYITVNPGEKVSALQVAAGGTLYVTDVV